MRRATNMTGSGSPFLLWRRKLGFILVWTVSHVVGGALGLLAAEYLSRPESLGRYAVVVGVVVFEGVVAWFKHFVFRWFREFNRIQILDVLSWVIAGIVVTVGGFLNENTYSEEITSLSFNIVRFSAFFGVNFAFIFQLPRIFNPETRQRLGGWREHVRGYLEERPFLKLFAYPSYLVTGLFLYILGSVFAAAYFAVLLFLVIGPIEFFKIEFQELLWPAKILWFGASSVGYAGFLTGFFYMVLLSLSNPLEKTSRLNKVHTLRK